MKGDHTRVTGGGSGGLVEKCKRLHEIVSPVDRNARRL